MRTNFTVLADAIEKKHQEHLKDKGKHKTQRLGSKGLVAAFRLAATYKPAHGEMLNFVEVTPHNVENKSGYTSRLEKKLGFLRMHPKTVAGIREAVGAGIHGDANSAWLTLLHHNGV